MQQSKLSIFILNTVFSLLFAQMRAVRLVENESQVGEGKSLGLTRFVNSAWAIGSMPRFRKGPIRKAVAAGNVERAKDLLRFGADANTRYQDDQTLLQRVVITENQEMAQLLIHAGADVNVRYGDGASVLHRAVIAGNQEIAQFLVRAGADVNARCQAGVSVLHRAIQFGPEELVSLLLERGADLEAYFPLDDNRRTNLTPLGLAIAEKNELLVRMILDAGAELKTMRPYGITIENGLSPLLVAVAMENYAIVRLLLERGAPVNCWFEWGSTKVTPVRIAVRKGNAQILQLLLEWGGFVHEGDCEALLVRAVKFWGPKAEEIVRLLLAHHQYERQQRQTCQRYKMVQDVPEGVTEALDAAIAVGNIQVAYLLLEAEADTTKLCNTGRETKITLRSSSFPRYIVDRCGKLPELAPLISLAEQKKVLFWIAVKSFLSPNMPRDLQRIVHECLVGKPAIDAMRLQPFRLRQQVVELEV